MVDVTQEIGAMFVGDGCEWTGDSMRLAYEAIVRTYKGEGIEPTSLGAKAPGVRSGWYVAFKYKRKHMDKVDFEKVEHFEILRLADGGKNEVTESIVTASVAARRQFCEVGIIPTLLGKSAGAFVDLFKQLTALGDATYGYMFYQRMACGPGMYVGGANYGDEGQRRDVEARMNISWWVGDHQMRLDSLLLRDIYPQSFVSADYLDAPIGKTAMTLREWIEDESKQRGTLEPFTDILTKWTPPIEKIPQIREELYRAGRVFYWRFFCPFHQDAKGKRPEPLYRPDPREPWEAPDPIPEIFRADYWKDKDPGLTY